MIPRTILFEPAVRGYRIELLSHAISAIRKRSTCPIFIVTRSNYATSELPKLNDPSHINLHFASADVDSCGVDTGSLDSRQFTSMLDTSAEVAGSDARSNVIFLGAEQYLPELIEKIAQIKCRHSKSRIFVMTHSHSDPSGSKPPAYACDGVNSMEEKLSLIANMGATLITLGDVQGCKVGHQPAVVLPDPWHGRFAPGQRARSRELLGFAPETLVVVATAECAEPGHSRAWRAVTETLIEARHTHLVLVGNAEKGGRSMPRRLFERLGNRVTHFGAFRGDARQRCLAAAADIMLASRTTAARQAPGTGSDTAQSATSPWHTRATDFGHAFDHEAARQLVESSDVMRSFTAREMTMFRTGLDRLSHECLLRTFRKRFASAMQCPD